MNKDEHTFQIIIFFLIIQYSLTNACYIASLMMTVSMHFQPNCDRNPQHHQPRATLSFSLILLNEYGRLRIFGAQPVLEVHPRYSLFDELGV